ncbi:MAG: CRISPR-associated protein Cas3 [Candidatus Brocadiaceae bacterium]|nr:CRISPR-associated protein Cas3 [Candidatus Brocadiaceae bacterium]
MTRNSKVCFAAHYRTCDGTAQSLQEHLEGCSTLAKAFAGKIGLSSFGELIGLLHDFGKYTDVFQAYLLSAVGNLNPDDDEYVDAKGMKGKIDHSSAGAQYVWEFLPKKDHLRRIAGQIISLCIASHHSGLMDCLSPDGIDVFSRRMAKPKDKTHLEEAGIKVDASIQCHANELLASTTIENELRRRLESLWRDKPSSEICAFRLGLLVRFVFSALIDADRLNSADFENVAAARERYNGCYLEWSVLVVKLEAHLAGFKAKNQVDKIRSEISLSCLNFASREKGIFQLTVPTGGGKTLASLRFALHHAKHHKMDRIIYVVPYTTIIDQNAKVVRSIFENTEHQPVASGKQIVLEHHSNLTPERDTWQSKLLSENWDAPIVYTTVVQFLETLFAAGTRGARRMHHLANTVIIFDEIQSIPIRTVHLFNNTINFLVKQCESTVVFCTATQPLLNEVDVRKGAVELSVNHQIMPDISKLFKDLRRVEVDDKRKTGGWSEDDVANEAQQELENTGSVLIIVNTKAQAREIYKRCKQITGEIFHLSTSMCPAHRMDILDKVKECLNPGNSKPVICVSTQLIEAGVDVDFGSVIRYLAGLDSIAQAAGRCNRNGLRQTGRVVVVNPANENLDKLPDIRTAKEKAERVLDEYRNSPLSFDNDRISPTAMTLYYRYHFFDRKHEMDYPVSSKEVGRDDTLLSLLSTNNLSVNAYTRTNNTAPPIDIRQSFKTAAEAFKVIEAPTEGVIVPYGEEGKRIITGLFSTAGMFEKKYKLLKAAQRYSVNMFPHEIVKLRQTGSLREVSEGSGILCLDPQHYSNEFGASIDRVALMETLIL